MTLASGGFQCSRLWSTSQLLRPSGQQCSHSAGSVHKSRGDNVVRHIGDGCVLASTLCKYDLRKGDLFVGQGCDKWGGEVSLQSY